MGLGPRPGPGLGPGSGSGPGPGPGSGPGPGPGSGSGPGPRSVFFSKNAVSGLSFFFNECCFRVRVRVRVRVDTNPNPKTAFSKKKIDHGRALNPAFY